MTALDAAARFGARATQYERHASVQELTAQSLARRIAALPLPSRPRIAEIGCGTGLLTRALAAHIGEADWTLTDIAPAMLAQARLRPPPGEVRYLALDGEHPEALPGGYDLICSSLAVQWFDDLDAGLERLAALLAPGGRLAIATLAEDTFVEWRRAHAALGCEAATRRYPPAHRVGATLRGMTGCVARAPHREQHRNGLAFLRGLKDIGATHPAPGHVPLTAAQLRAVLNRFDQEDKHVTYDIAYGIWQRPPAGVFVTGTDTGVGKTLVCAVMTRAWQAHYWKPLQTGLADEEGDTATVARLAELPDDRWTAPAYALQAPLAPWAAAALEAVRIDATALALPNVSIPLVVEGAGGLYVPVDDEHMILDLIAQWRLPAVLVARSGLGTINHTLLSLQALRARGVPILGVVMNGPPSPGNRQAIERFGGVRVLAEIPSCGTPDAPAVARLAEAFPSWRDTWAHPA